MKFIYWNTKRIESLNEVVDICEHHEPDLFFLSEIDNLLLEKEDSKLKEKGYIFFPNPGCERVSIIKKIELDVELGLQAKYYTAVKIPASNLYVVSIHLPSQMFQHMDALKEFIRDFRMTIDSEIGTSLQERILIIGDFNVNPYEKPMIDFDGFLATNSVNSRSEITHLGKKRPSYYNPTWQLYSRKHFPGTKHFKRPSGASYDIIEFHYLDQVVVSQCLKKEINHEEIGVIETTKNFTFFCNEENLVQNSDHLPIFYTFKLH